MIYCFTILNFKNFGIWEKIDFVLALFHENATLIKADLNLQKCEPQKNRKKIIGEEYFGNSFRQANKFGYK